MLKLLVSGSYPLVDFVKKEIFKRRDSIPNLTIQEVDSKHILKRPYYIRNDDILHWDDPDFEEITVEMAKLFTYTFHSPKEFVHFLFD